MAEQKIILETNFTDPYENDPRLKFLLVDELHNGIHFSYISKWQDSTGVEGGTETYFDFEKALKKFIKRVAEERKQGCNHKNLKIIGPNLTNDFSSQKTGIKTNSNQSISDLIDQNRRLENIESTINILCKVVNKILDSIVNFWDIFKSLFSKGEK